MLIEKETLLVKCYILAMATALLRGAELSAPNKQQLGNVTSRGNCWQQKQARSRLTRDARRAREVLFNANSWTLEGGFHISAPEENFCPSNYRLLDHFELDYKCYHHLRYSAV
jgi:hypothetical protein